MCISVWELSSLGGGGAPENVPKSSDIIVQRSLLGLNRLKKEGCVFGNVLHKVGYCRTKSRIFFRTFFDFFKEINIDNDKKSQEQPCLTRVFFFLGPSTVYVRYENQGLHFLYIVCTRYVYSI